jgi:hypothetical protein
MKVNFVISLEMRSLERIRLVSEVFRINNFTELDNTVR